MRSAITSTDFGPCCLFRVLDIRSALVKTPRPDPTVQCSRIESIKNYRQSIGKINTNKNKLTAIPKDQNLELHQYFQDPIQIFSIRAAIVLKNT